MLINTILKKTVFKYRLNLLTDKEKLYSQIKHTTDIYDYQITQFNKVWKNAINNVITE
jgi:hypothetical protein